MKSSNHISFFAPMRIPKLRRMLGFELSASVGVWILVLAAQWTLTESGESALVVSSVQFAASVPFFLLALPIGAIAEFAGHRLLLAGTAIVLLVASIVMTALQLLGLSSTPALMTAVFLAGCGLASVAIVWQALLPHLVPADMMAVVPAIDGAIFNGARAVGPVIGGAILAWWGSSGAFATVAALFAVCVVVALTQVPPESGKKPKTESVHHAVGVSVRFIRHSRWTRRLLLRVITFGIPASALWALLPVVAYERLHASSVQFGVLSGAIGIGAVAGTVALMPLRARLSWNTFVAIGSIAYAAVLAGIVLVPSVSVVFVLLVIVGAAWVAIQSTWMIATHAVMPKWIKSRVIAFVMLTFQGSQAVGALLWGFLADAVGLVAAVIVSAAIMSVSAVEILRRGILPSESIAPDLSGGAGPPVLSTEFDGRRITVETTYVVDPEKLAQFVDDVGRLRSSRLRLGAVRWSCAQMSSTRATFVELCTFENWSEYAAQETERLTVPEHRIRTAIASHLTAEPQVRVLVDVAPR
ncbi:hypothetical protein RhoFasSB10_01482 [Rhodococcus fascians]|uniref:MFS transporter n=1 Tax=Rhodococcoides fascians TaxID=1828 RepID=UPI001427B3CD|nr:hypothetical protein [Rhodococcus fascians]